MLESLRLTWYYPFYYLHFWFLNEKWVKGEIQGEFRLRVKPEHDEDFRWNSRKMKNFHSIFFCMLASRFVDS